MIKYNTLISFWILEMHYKLKRLKHNMQNVYNYYFQYNRSESLQHKLPTFCFNNTLLKTSEAYNLASTHIKVFLLSTTRICNITQYDRMSILTTSWHLWKAVQIAHLLQSQK